MLFKLFLSVFLFAVLSLNAAGLTASCGALSCPIAVHQETNPVPGTVTLNYSYQYINQDEARVGTDKARIGQIRGHHDELATVSRVQTLEAAAVIHPRFSVSVAVPMVQREHQHVHNHRGAALLESWSFSGLGDTTLMTRTGLLTVERNRPSIGLLLGGKFPTGKTNARGTAQVTGNALESTEAEIGIQPGSGAYDFLAGLAGEHSLPAPMLTREPGSMSLIVEVTGRFTGKGKDDYRLGNSLLASAGALYPLTRKLGLSMQINGRYSRPDEKGATSEEIDKTGGVWVYASPGLRVRLSESIAAYIHVQTPVYQNVNSIQLVSAYNLLSGITYTFNVLH